ncbi:hypothetical protein [Aestuariirhabdus litorea]|uniref:Surface antigen domain-containing protein n=1 Tax=Aestuariirhabdus litorea TaxID=2528527 RepID=A0A3P3VQR7_9GAMM|nr:hypothetical protein [Aestuariirhabdus litorea]RRJ84308.1 hypothetical protein D0544_04155 [Aestuariirhabdus litorea]RWW97531.1 hypothetical protein DZC74_04155 [Endozoicomonadaceae bacterium GTF-13]
MSVREPISDELLCAYMDNELDLPTRQRLEQQLGEDETLRDRLQALVEADTLVRQAFNQRTPIHASGTQLSTPTSGAGGWFARAGGLLAASVAGLVIGMNLPASTGSGASPAQWSPQQTLSRSLENLPQFQNTMERNISGVAQPWSNPDQPDGRLLPVRTYRTGSGTYCREFLLEDPNERVTGVVCRTPQGHWQIVDMQYSQRGNSPNLKI